jgi:NADH-quinone oxidoreductase subunit J
VIFLVISFFGSAMLFYLLGAPLLAALEVIIYAGAIMILFLFIIMMLKTEGMEENLFPRSQYLPAMGLSIVSLVVCVLLMFFASPENREPMKTAVALPSVFGHFLFSRHWLSIEVVSMLLLVALVGVLHLGMQKKNGSQNKEDL